MWGTVLHGTRIDSLATKAAFTLLEYVAAWASWYDLRVSYLARARLNLAESGVKGQTRVGVGEEEMGIGSPKRIVKLGEDFCSCGWGEDVLA